MKTKDLWRLLLAPLASIYALAIYIRNTLYETRVLRSSSFQIPILNVGNLSMGGTGKTPHLDYLITLLKPYIDLGTLSRGYGRKTSGFREVSTRSKSSEVGDEPLMLKLKHPEIPVFVGEDRVLSVPMILKSYPNLQCILLDDAFQHRAINPFLNFVLTPYQDLYIEDFILPMGRLREFRSGHKRAQAILVTKCPNPLSAVERNDLSKKIFPDRPERVFFSSIAYGQAYPPFEDRLPPLSSNTDVLLVTGIANNQSLKTYAKQQFRGVKFMDFSDHHQFTRNDVAQVAERYQKLDSDNKIVLTTEKDLMRLLEHREYLSNENVPLYVLPIRVQFIDDDGDRFQAFIKNSLLQFKV